MPNSFPRSSIPLLPVLDRLSWARDDERARPVERRVAFEQTIFTHRGTSAIALVLAAAEVGAGHEVLIPSVHCDSVREAVLAVGAQPVIYRTMPDLTADFEDLRAKTTSRSKALIAIQFFGFLQPLEGFRSHCDDADLLLIEDCAHAWLRYANGEREEFADAVIGSATKFFPVAEGGFVSINNRDAISSIHLRRTSLRTELKSLANMLEVSFGFGRLPVLSALTSWIFALRRRLRASDTATESAAPAGNSAGSAGNAFKYIDPKAFDAPMSRISRSLYKRFPVRRAAAGRRRNYQRLVSHLEGIHGIEPLVPDLPELAIPYMVPCLLSDPANTFPQLKHAGLPMYRWEDTVHSDCDVGEAYRQSLIQLPCHESLTDAELKLMRDTITDAIGDGQYV